jgi:hypothetical protein
MTSKHLHLLGTLVATPHAQPAFACAEAGANTAAPRGRTTTTTAN